MSAISKDAPLTVSAQDGTVSTNLMIRPRKHYWYTCNILEQGIKDGSPSYKVNYPGFLKNETDWVRVDSERLLPYIPEKFVPVGDYAFIFAGTKKPQEAKPKTVPVDASSSDLVPYPKGMPQLEKKARNKKRVAISVSIVDLTGPSATAVSQEQPSRGRPPPRNRDQGVPAAAAAADQAGTAAPSGAPAGGSDMPTAEENSPVSALVPARKPGLPRGPVKIDLTSLHQEFGISEAEEGNEGTINSKRPLEATIGEGTADGTTSSAKKKTVDESKAPSLKISGAPSAPPESDNYAPPGLKMGCSKCRQSRKGCSKCRPAATQATLEGGAGPLTKPAAKRQRIAAKPAAVESVPPHSSSSPTTEVSLPKVPVPVLEEETTLAGNVAAELQPSDAAPSISNEEGPAAAAAIAAPAPLSTAAAEPVLANDVSLDAALSPKLAPGPSATPFVEGPLNEAPVPAPKPSTSLAIAPPSEPAVPLESQQKLGSLHSKLSKYMSTVPGRILSLAVQPNWTAAQAWKCQFMALSNPVCWAMAVMSLYSTVLSVNECVDNLWLPVTVAMLRFVEPWQNAHMLEGWANTVLASAVGVAAAGAGAASGGVSGPAATETAPSRKKPPSANKEAQPSKSTLPVETESELAMQKSPSYNQNMHLMEGQQATTPLATTTTQRTKKRKIHTPRSVTETLAACLGKFAPDADGNLPRRSRKGARMASLLVGDLSGDEGGEGVEDEEQGVGGGDAAAGGKLPGAQTPYFWEIGGSGNLGDNQWDALNTLVGLADGEISEENVDGAHADDAAGGGGGDKGDAVLPRATARRLNREIRQLEEKLKAAEHREETLKIKLQAKPNPTRPPTAPTPPPVSTSQLELRHLNEESFQAEWQRFCLRRSALEANEQTFAHREAAFKVQTKALERDARAVKFQVEAIAKERSTLVQTALPLATMLAAAGDYKVHAQVQEIIQNLRKIAAPKASRVVIPALPALGPVPARGLPGRPTGPLLANGAAGRRFNISNGMQGVPSGRLPPPFVSNERRGLPGTAPHAASMRMPLPSQNNTNISGMQQQLQRQLQQQQQHSQIAAPMPSRSEQLQSLQQQLTQMVDNRRLFRGDVPSGLQPVQHDGNAAPWNLGNGAWKLPPPPPPPPSGGALHTRPPLQYAYKERPTPPEAAMHQQQQISQGTLAQPPPHPQSPREPSIKIPFDLLETSLGSGNGAVQLMRTIASGDTVESDDVNLAALLLAEALHPMIRANPQYESLKINFDDSNNGLPSTAIVNLVRSLIFTLQESE